MKKLWLVIIVVGLFSAGCASIDKREQAFRDLGELVKQQRYEEAIDIISGEKKKELYTEKSKVLFFLDVGTLYHYAGNYEQSNEYLTQAEYLIEELYTESISDIAALPLFALVLGAYGLLTMPLTNAFSRWRERRADQFALTLTGKGPAYASALARLADQNLSEADPEPWVEWLLYSHPALGKRIAMAQEER